MKLGAWSFVVDIFEFCSVRSFSVQYISCLVHHLLMTARVTLLEVTNGRHDGEEIMSGINPF